MVLTIACCQVPMRARSLASNCGRCLQDGRRSSAAHAAGWVQGIDAEELVQQAAGDAQHGSAAVLALSVQLEGLGLGVIVTHPWDVGNVADLATIVVVLSVGSV